MPNARQIKAAKALAGLTTKEAAALIDIAAHNLRRIEDGSAKPKDSTIKKIIEVYEKFGVVFTKNGIEEKDKTVTVIDSSEGVAYLKLLDDIFYTLHESGGEVLFLYAEDGVTTEEGEAAEARLHQANITFRNIVSDEAECINGQPEEYRSIPAAFFNNELVVIYGNKVAQFIDKGEKIIVVENNESAAMMRNTFEFIWHHGAKVGNK